MKIVFNPPIDKGNLYPQLISQHLEIENVHVYSLKAFLSSMALRKDIKIIHLNWFENLKGRTILSIFVDFCLRCFFLLFIKISGRKIVWTMHNNAPHDSASHGLESRFMSILMKYADIIVIHSRVSEQIILSNDVTLKQKIRYVPHPNYVGSYGSILKSSSSHSSLRLLFIGAIKPYKNIELLADVVKSFNGNDVSLIIAGNAKDVEYGEKLSKYIDGISNVELQLGFIKDSEIPILLSKCDLVVLPYNIKSSLNSGTIILAFSYMKTVISPLIGTVSDLENRADLLLSYDYNDRLTHQEKLKQTIGVALELKEKDNSVFDKMGRSCYNLVLNQYDKQQVACKLVDVYNELI